MLQRVTATTLPLRPPLSPPRLVRPLTPTQEIIADGIRRGLSYGQIAREIGRSSATVRAHVRMMGERLEGLEDFGARQRIFIWAMHQDWSRALTRR